MSNLTMQDAYHWCKECKKSFSSKYTLQRHQKLTHKEEGSKEQAIRPPPLKRQNAAVRGQLEDELRGENDGDDEKSRDSDSSEESESGLEDGELEDSEEEESEEERRPRNPFVMYEAEEKTTRKRKSKPEQAAKGGSKGKLQLTTPTKTPQKRGPKPGTKRQTRFRRVDAEELPNYGEGTSQATVSRTTTSSEEGDEELPPFWGRAVLEIPTHQLDGSLSKFKEQIKRRVLFRGRRVTVESVPLVHGSLNPDYLMHIIQSIWAKHDFEPIKMYLMFSLLLYNTVTREIEWFFASHNTNVLSDGSAVYLRDEESLDRLRDKLEHENWRDRFEEIGRSSDSDDSGQSECSFPLELLTNKNYICFKKDRHAHNALLSSRMSFFYCIAYFLTENLVIAVREGRRMLFEIFPHLTSEIQFGGVDPFLDEQLLRRICMKFDVNLAIHASCTRTLNLTSTPVVFHHMNNKNVHTAHLLCLTRIRPYHFVYVKNFKLMKSPSGFMSCKACDSIVTHSKNMSRHVKDNCPTMNTFLETGKQQPFKTNVEYPTKKYEPRKLLSDYLEYAGLDTSCCSVDYPFLIIYDTESINENPGDTSEIKGCTDRTLLMSEHKLCAISATSNVPEFQDAKCWVVDPSDSLSTSTSIIQDFVTYSLEVAGAAEKCYLAQVDPLLKQIEQRQISARKGDNPRGHALLTSCDMRVRDYGVQIPILGYNSSSFDIPLLRNHGFFNILNRMDSGLNGLKKGRRYTVINTKKMKFIDILNFLSGKMSLRVFLKSFDSPTEKDYFPYDLLNSMDKLNDATPLPLYEDFQNSMTNSNLLDADYKSYMEGLAGGLSEKQLQKQLNLTSSPLTGRQLYETLKLEWKRKRFTCLRDLLVDYAKGDVQPLRDTVLKILNTFTSRFKIDLFKTSVSLPSAILPYGLRQVQHQSEQKIFLYGEFEMELLQKSLMGGLSMIFTHRCEVGKSKIKEHQYGDAAKSVKAILQYDANNLYGWAMAESVPCGPYITRLKEEQFEAHYFGKRYSEAMKWLAFQSWIRGKSIQTKANFGEKVLWIKRKPKEEEEALILNGAPIHVVSGVGGTTEEEISEKQLEVDTNEQPDSLSESESEDDMPELESHCNHTTRVEFEHDSDSGGLSEEDEVYDEQGYSTQHLTEAEETSLIFDREAEQKYQRVLVDGWINPSDDLEVPGVVFEFLECSWHGNCDECRKKPDFDGDAPHPVLAQKTANILRDEWEERYAALRGLGHKVVFIWGCEFTQLKKENNYLEMMQEYGIRGFPRIMKRKLTEQQLLDYIASGEITGYLTADFNIPENLRSYYDQFPIIPKHTTLTPEMLCPIMKQFNDRTKIMTLPRKTLLTGFSATQVTYTTDLVKWLLKKGVEVTNVTSIIQVEFSNILAEVVDGLTDLRREGDASGNVVLSNSAKLSVNSFYGSTLYRKWKKGSNAYIRFVQEKNYTKWTRKSNFVTSIPVGEPENPENLFEVKAMSRKMTANLPLSIGFSILNTSKLSIFKFYYDFLLKYFGHENVSALQCDTDAVTFAISTDGPVEELVPKHLLADYWRDLNKYVVCGDEENAEFRKRQPGLYKLENKGTRFIGLASKLYVLDDVNQDGTVSQHKITSKGIQKGKNMELLAYENFDNALKSLTDETLVMDQTLTTGIREFDDRQFTFKTNRTGLCPFDPKRYLHDNLADTSTYVDC